MAVKEASPKDLYETASAEKEFTTLIDALKMVCEDVEQIHSTRGIIEKLKTDIMELLRAVMIYSEIRAVAVPKEALKEFGEAWLAAVDSITLDRSGVILVKGRHTEIRELREFPADMVISIFNGVAPELKKDIGKQRRRYERNLEALQAIKGSLSAVEKSGPAAHK